MLSAETIISRLLLAFILGGLIGIEREFRNKSAGLRTLALICLGSCLFTIVSLLIIKGSGDRIASNIVTGIGFIGAGVIFKSEKGVNGITTASSIWITAAIGMAIGSGLYLESIITCAIVILILSLFTWIEDAIDKINQEKLYKIVSNYQPEILLRYENIMKKNSLRFKRQQRSRANEDIIAYWIVFGSLKNHDRFVEEILKDTTIKEFDF